MELQAQIYLLSLKKTEGKDGRLFYKLGIQVGDDVCMISCSEQLAKNILSGSIPLHNEYTLLLYYSFQYGTLSARDCVPFS